MLTTSRCCVTLLSVYDVGYGVCPFQPSACRTLGVATFVVALLILFSFINGALHAVARADTRRRASSINNIVVLTRHLAGVTSFRRPRRLRHRRQNRAWRLRAALIRCCAFVKLERVDSLASCSRFALRTMFCCGVTTSFIVTQHRDLCGATSYRHFVFCDIARCMAARNLSVCVLARTRLVPNITYRRGTVTSALARRVISFHHACVASFVSRNAPSRFARPLRDSCLPRTCLATRHRDSFAVARQARAFSTRRDRSAIARLNVLRRCGGVNVAICHVARRATSSGAC